jgi:cyclic 2,3-diphosphoglycerate synthetase
MRAVAVIDGEHYAPVVRDALRSLPYEVVAAWRAGGAEKLVGGEDYGVPLAEDLDDAISTWEPDVVYDLSDEPVLGPRERLRTASRVLARGVPYEGPDFRLEPPGFAPLELPSLAVVGTGKRVGKTAVTGHVARLLSRDRRVVVVAMGRGGPPEPELVEQAPTLDELLERARAGLHAASDHLETAALVRVPTVGCRRCGGGLAGATGISNVLDGVDLARRLDPDLLLFDGSGAALPPVAADARVLVVPAHQPPEVAAGYLNAYRILLADLVVLTHCEEGTQFERIRAAVAEVKDVPTIATVQRPRPVAPVAGRRVALFTTAPPAAQEVLGQHLEREHGALEVAVSGNLADRTALRADLERIDAEVFVVELKAAAVDVVAEAALERGIPLVLADADIRTLPGEPDLDEALLALVRAPEPSVG